MKEGLNVGWRTIGTKKGGKEGRKKKRNEEKTEAIKENRQRRLMIKRKRGGQGWRK